MYLKKTILLTLMALCTTPILGQTTPLSLTKAEIIERSWKAMFGSLKQDEVKSLYVEALHHGRPVPSKHTVKRPNLFRNEASSGLLIFDGQRGPLRERLMKTGTPVIQR